MPNSGRSIAAARLQTNKFKANNENSAQSNVRSEKEIYVGSLCDDYVRKVFTARGP
jgi:hypothetical protein